MDFEDYSLREISIGAKVFSGFAFKSTDMNDEQGIPIVKIKNIQNGEVTLGQSQYFPEALVNEKIANFFLQDKDVLIAMTGQGSVGRVGQLKLNGEKALLNQRVGKFIVDEKNLERDYLYFVISSPRYEKILFDTGTGSGQPNLSPAQILSIEIPMPPIEIQRKISEALRCLNDKINLNKKMNITLDAICRVIFKHWFVHFEFPNEEGKPYKSSGGKMTEHGEASIPKGWEIKRFEKITEAIFSGGTPDTRNNEYWDGDYSWLSSGETSDLFILKTEKKITKKGIENSSTRLAKEGDIVIASAGQGKTRGQTALCLIDTYVNQSVNVVRSKNSIVPNSYLFLDLSLRYPQLRAISDSFSIRGSLTTKLVKELEILLPPLKCTIAFDKWFNLAVRKIHSNLMENEALFQIRDSLLPRLMSGKIKIPIDDKMENQ
jgi:type I restriction enzyme S subunit